MVKLPRGMTIALVLTALAVPAAADEPATQLAEAFCAARLAYDEEAIRALLSADLLDLIARAEEVDARIAAAEPDEKPPLGDGIPYTSYWDAPESCTPGAVINHATASSVEVVYSYAGEPDWGWTDRLVVVPVEDRLAIDDVLFHKREESDEQHTMRGSLEWVLEQ